MKSQLRTCVAAIMMVALMIGSSFVATAAVSPRDKISTTYDWLNPVINTVVAPYVDDVIHVNGTLRIASGGSLTLQNTTLIMYSNATFNSSIEVQSGGTLRLIDDGDGHTPMDVVNDTDASVIMANNSLYHYNFYVRDGAHFDVDRSVIHNAGGVTTAANSYLEGGSNPDDEYLLWQLIQPQTQTAGSFRVTINGVSANITGIGMAGPWYTNIGSMNNVASIITAQIQNLNMPDFSGAVCTWTGTEFNLTSGNDDPFKSSSITPLGTVVGRGVDISGATVRPAVVLGGTNAEHDFWAWMDGAVGVHDGTFRVTINGVTRNVGPLNFPQNYTTGWWDIPNVVTDGLHNAGFASAYCVMANYRFMISAGTGGLTSSVSNLSKHSGGVGTDISGMTLNGNGHRWLDCWNSTLNTVYAPGYWMDCADNATSYGHVAADATKAGIYIRSGFVNVEDSLISENAYALLFDSCLPETLLYNNITDNTGTGLSVLNRTTPGYAINYELHDNIFAGNYRAIQFRGTTITLNAHNLNVSENQFGMEFYANSQLTADIHDNDVWLNDQPYGTGSNAVHGAATVYLLAGDSGTIDASIERNNIVGNFRGGVWAGYVHGGTPTRNLNLLVANNTLSGNDGGEWFHASNVLNVKIVDNYLGSSNISGRSPGERFRIGFAADEVGNPGPLAAPVTTSIEVARNTFWYENADDSVYCGGVFRVGGKDSIDMSFVDNDFTVLSYDYVYLGGIIRAGKVPTGDDTNIVCKDIDMDLSRNNFRLEVMPTNSDYEIDVGGLCTLYALNNIDVSFNDNSVHAIARHADISGLSMLRADRTASETYEPDMPHGCDYVNVEVCNNEFDFRSTSDTDHSVDCGGLFRFAGEFTTNAVFNDNSVNMVGYIEMGGLFQAGEILNLLGKSKNMNADVFRNTVKYLYDEDLDRGPSQGGSFLFNAWDNVDVDFEDNNVYSTYGGGTILAINNGPSGVNSGLNLANFTTAVVRNNVIVCNPIDAYSNSGSGIGGLIRMAGNKSLTTIIDNNELVANSDDPSIGGIIRLGYPDGRSSDPNPVWNMLDNLEADITNNRIFSTVQSTDIGGVIRTFANGTMDMDILNNVITVVDIGNGADFGHIIAVGWGDYENDSEAQAKITDARINNNDINVYYGDGTQANGVQVRGDVITLEMNDNNLLGHSGAIDSTNVLGVRIGYICESNGILSNYTDVSMSNNRIENGARNAAVHVGALKDIDFSFIGGTAMGAKECESYPEWTTYGNGITLEAVNVTAIISNAEFANNRGAGIYVNASNDAQVTIDNCNVHDNGWHGIALRAEQGRVTGAITDTEIMGNTGDIYDVIADPDDFSGLYARNATLSLTNCNLYNPDSLYELELVNETHVVALDTNFDRYKALVDVDDSTLLVKWTLDVLTIHMATGNPLPGCVVTVRNVTNAIVGNGITGTDGHWTDAIVDQYYRTATTWTNYTDHTFLATRTPASATRTIPVDSVMTVVLVLDYVSPPPVAEAGDNQTVGQGTIVTLNGSASTDDIPPIVSYVWTFNNGTANITLTGMAVTYNFTDIGTYNVTLVVTDVLGYNGTDNMWVTVTDSYAPIANAGPDMTVDEDTLVTFNGTGSSDAVGIVNYTWEFVDTAAVTLYGVAPTYTFAQPGSYFVTLTVMDAAGNSATDNMTVFVNDITDPVAAAGADQTVAEGATVTFDASGSSDNVLITGFEWTFNDGANDVTLYGMTNNYTFPNIGSYEVTLVAYDAAGNSAADIMWVHVVDVTPPAILVISPGDSLTDVPLNWSLVIVFTEPMNKTSVEGAFTFSGPQTPTFVWDATGRYVHVTFANGLAYETTYTFTIGTNATDLSGNHLTAAYSGTFTTAAEPEEPEPPVEPETNFFTDNWWILVVIIVVLAVLLLVSLLKGGKKEPAAPEYAGAPPAPPEEPAPIEEPPLEPAPEELPPEEP